MSAEPTVQVDLFAPSLVEATTRRLRDEILSGALEPGSRLIEEQICQRFSISRAPLRESLRLLVQQGLVEHLPRRGARVTVWSEEDIRQLFEIRAVLERHAITTALPMRIEPGVDPLAAGPGSARPDATRRERRPMSWPGRRAPRVPRRDRCAGRQPPTRPGDGTDSGQAATADGDQSSVGGQPGRTRGRPAAARGAADGARNQRPGHRSRSIVRPRRPAIPAVPDGVGGRSDPEPVSWTGADERVGHRSASRRVRP